MSVTTTKKWKAGAVLLAATALAITLSGCAGGASSGPDALSGSGVGAEAGSFNDWQLAFAKCMRDEGVDMPDPSGTGMGMAIDGNQDMAAFDAASTKCRSELGDPPPLSEQEKAEIDAASLQWARDTAKCYRENGYDVADPSSAVELKLPQDAPDDVIAECGGGGSSALTQVGGNER